MSDPSPLRGLRPKRRPHTTGLAIVFGVLSILGLAWRLFDTWSRLEFISQKSGWFWTVLHFLFATQMGANIIVLVFVSLLVASLLFRLKRPSTLPPADDSMAMLAPAERVLLSPIAPLVEPEPNLVLLRCDTIPCLRRSGMFVDWPEDQSVPVETIYRARVAVIDNKGSRGVKAGTAHDVSARLIYPHPSGSQHYEVPRGAWLSEVNSKINLYPSRSRRLILAVVPHQGLQDLHGVELNENSTYGATTQMIPLNTRTMTVAVALESGGTVLKDWEITVVLNESGSITSSPEQPDENESA